MPEIKNAPKKKRASTKKKSDPPAFAKSYAELATIIGVTRQSLHRWLKEEGSPAPRADGRHSVKAWLEFMANTSREPRSHDLDSLKARDLLAKCEERELKNAIKRAEFVSVEEVRLIWGTCTAKALQLLEKALLDELPPILAGKEPLEIRIDLENTLNEVRGIIHNGDEGLTP